MTSNVENSLPDWHTAFFPSELPSDLPSDFFSDDSYPAWEQVSAEDFDDFDRNRQENFVPYEDFVPPIFEESDKSVQTFEQSIEQVIKQPEKKLVQNPSSVPVLANMSLNPSSNELTQSFLALIDYLYIRQTLKNSLSKNINFQINPAEKQKILTLFGQLTEQLNEGHTILLDTQFSLETYQTWQTMGWVTLLPFNQTTYTTPSPVQTPLVVKNLTQHNNPRAVVWLHRQWYAERQLATQLMEIATRQVPELSLTESNQTAGSKLNPRPNSKPKILPNAQQQLAIEKATQNALCIITGGPGTGKTFTVAQLVIALHHAHEKQKALNPQLPPLSISLTAPTGKAAQRMQESLEKSLIESLSGEDGKKIAIDNAKTLHRLLGIGSNGVPRYHKDNPLPDDLIIVDEASMLGLELAGLLVDAIKPTARLILLGDANQLAAVDAGAVLADLCAVPALAPYRVALSESKRFDDHSPIGQLASAITQVAITPDEQRQKIIKTLSLLPKTHFNNEKTAQKESNNLTDIRFFSMDKQTDLRQVYDELVSLYQPYFSHLQGWQSRTPDVYDEAIRKQLFTVFDGFRVLSAGHHGNLGVKMINQMLTKRYKKQAGLPLSDSPFFHGQPIMMLKNDYQLGLFNGDIGICIQQVSEDSRGNAVLGDLVICFPQKVVPSNRISQDSCETAYAFTIHKSQGSEYEHVAVCLDTVHRRLLSQELIYTAITRSKQKLSLFSGVGTLRMAILQKGNRQTGLILQFD